MSDLWRIRKTPNLPKPWVVHDPDGNWAGRYDTWREAMDSIDVGQVSRWLAEVSG